MEGRRLGRIRRQCQGERLCLRRSRRAGDEIKEIVGVGSLVWSAKSVEPLHLHCICEDLLYSTSHCGLAVKTFRFAGGEVVICEAGWGRTLLVTSNSW
jgi:hypothetical protein